MKITNLQMGGEINMQNGYLDGIHRFNCSNTNNNNIQCKL